MVQPWTDMLDVAMCLQSRPEIPQTESSLGAIAVRSDAHPDSL